jgi:hypothetical protein
MKTSLKGWLKNSDGGDWESLHNDTGHLRSATDENLLGRLPVTLAALGRPDYAGVSLFIGFSRRELENCENV